MLAVWSVKLLLPRLLIFVKRNYFLTTSGPSMYYRLEDPDIGSLGRQQNFSSRAPARKMPNGHALRLGTAVRGMLQDSH